MIGRLKTPRSPFEIRKFWFNSWSLIADNDRTLSHNFVPWYHPPFFFRQWLCSELKRSTSKVKCSTSKVNWLTCEVNWPPSEIKWLPSKVNWLTCEVNWSPSKVNWLTSEVEWLTSEVKQPTSAVKRSLFELQRSHFAEVRGLRLNKIPSSSQFFFTSFQSARAP